MVMALDVSTLSAMSTLELVKLRDSYTVQKINLPKQRYRAAMNLSTDKRRCDDAIRMINVVIKQRQRARQPLREFTG
jgi:hypothetical protein